MQFSSATNIRVRFVRSRQRRLIISPGAVMTRAICVRFAARTISVPPSRMRAQSAPLRTPAAFDRIQRLFEEFAFRVAVKYNVRLCDDSKTWDELQKSVLAHRRANFDDLLAAQDDGWKTWTATCITQCRKTIEPSSTSCAIIRCFFRPRTYCQVVNSTTR